MMTLVFVTQEVPALAILIQTNIRLVAEALASQESFALSNVGAHGFEGIAHPFTTTVSFMCTAYPRYLFTTCW